MNKARAGRSVQVRTCLSCNQECVGRMGLGRWLGCTENPRAGRESVPLPMPRRRGRTVVVVGWRPGPACKLRATAAQRGHAVTLFERERRLGGQILTASVVPARRELADPRPESRILNVAEAGVTDRVGCWRLISRSWRSARPRWS